MSKFKEVDELSQAIFTNGEAPSLTPDTRGNLKAYKNNYILTLVEALLTKFPVVTKILGPSNFKYFSREYILKNPSSSSNIDNYGETFANFLQQQPQLEDLSTIGSFAQLDWLYTSTHESGKSIETPSGVFEAWDAYMRNADDVPFETQDYRETVSLHILKNSRRLSKS